jgi:hypothetical protein
MSSVEFEPTILVFERAKTVHALYRSATAIGRILLWSIKYTIKFTCVQFEPTRAPLVAHKAARSVLLRAEFRL